VNNNNNKHTMFGNFGISSFAPSNIANIAKVRTNFAPPVNHTPEKQNLNGSGGGSSGGRGGSARKRLSFPVPSNPPNLELHYITQQMCCIPHPKMEGKAPAIGNFLAETHPHKFMLWNFSDNPTSQPVYTEFSNQVQQQCRIHWMPIVQCLPFTLLLHIGSRLFLEHRKVEKPPPVASGDF
jgi:hypothetical protein